MENSVAQQVEHTSGRLNLKDRERRNKLFRNRMRNINCRGVARDSDWFGVLHLKSEGYEKITKVYKKCIRENLREPKGNKVYRVVDEL